MIWYLAKPSALQRTLEEISSAQPRLTAIPTGDEILLRGFYEVRGTAAHAEFELEIRPCSDSETGMPAVREIGGRIPRDMDLHHVNGDGTLCVMLPEEYWFTYPGGLSLADFLAGPLRRHLAAQEYVLGTGKWPGEEWAHGDAGVLEFYRGLFETDDERVLRGLLEWALRDKLPTLMHCHCGSRRELRHCHGPLLQKLRERLPKDLLRTALRAASSGVKKAPRVSWRMAVKRKTGR